MLRTIALSVIVAAGALPAAAQGSDIDQVITAYNEAATSGSQQDRVAAAKALGAAAQANPGRDDAGLLAYEAGQTLCVLAACEGAAQMAEFAASAPLLESGVTQADVAVLAAYADWMAEQSNRNRRALDDALEEVTDHDVSMLTLSAFQARYVNDFERSDFRDAKASASAAATHFEPFWKVIGKEWSDAEIAAVIASFSDEPEPQDALDMARHRVKLAQIRSQLDEEPEWLEAHRHLSHAWRLALTAYFNSGGGRRTGSLLRGPDPDQLASEIDAIEAGIDEFSSSETQVDATGQSDGETGELPFCDGSLNMYPPLRYPGGAARQGMFGSVIVRFSVDDLDVSDVEVLAAVPSSTFEDSAEQTVEKWSWDVSSGKPGETCRTSRTDIVLPLIFELQR